MLIDKTKFNNFLHQITNKSEKKIKKQKLTN